MLNHVRNFFRDESGASLAEYAILLVILGGATIVALGALQTGINARINAAATTVTP
jgi:Flp pilus assembly pilin Flp